MYEEEKIITSESIRKELNKLPISWSKISEELAGKGKKTVIRGKGRDPIPEKYFKDLQKIADSLNWLNVNKS